jgi:nickel-dependent lactate racemase
MDHNGMPVYSLPYGTGQLSFSLPDDLDIQIVTPPVSPEVPDPIAATEAALTDPIGEVALLGFRDVRSVAIAINDQTRPVPHQYLLPPLLEHLGELGLVPEQIRLIIASGAHPPMRPETYPEVVPSEILNRYPVQCHDADATQDLVYLGTTTRGTPVWVHSGFVQADLRIVVGSITPHQFQGFSGGVKGVAIGLAGRETINHNHAMMTDPRAQLGRYLDNPARQDVEEIGQIIGVHWALNVLLNDRKELVKVIAGEPRPVLEAGIPLCREFCQVAVAEPFDLILASPGGHPKDLNLYQAQKALAHAGLITRDGGTVILTAACPQGPGSRSYEAWLQDMSTNEQVLARFEGEEFRVGPHKAYQIARDAVRLRVLLVSNMAPERVRRLLLTPVDDIAQALEWTFPRLPAGARIGLLPQASATIPYLTEG